MCVTEFYLRRNIEGAIWDVKVANNQDKAGGHGSSGRCRAVR
jgi:hypothetical protein